MAVTVISQCYDERRGKTKNVGAISSTRFRQDAVMQVAWVSRTLILERLINTMHLGIGQWNESSRTGSITA
jgi:hypothetical protein